MFRNLFDPGGPKRVLSTSLKGSAIALCALALASSPALAANTIPAAGGTINASGGWNTTTGLPDSCDSTEWLWVINGLSDNTFSTNSKGGINYHAWPDSITVQFDNLNVDVTPATVVDLSFTNPPGSTIKYSLAATPTNSQYLFDGATAVFTHSTDKKDMTYNNFVLSHGPCASAPPPPPPPPPPPGATPELDSLALFGTGAAGLLGYGLMRFRARKREE